MRKAGYSVETMAPKQGKRRVVVEAYWSLERREDSSTKKS